MIVAVFSLGPAIAGRQLFQEQTDRTSPLRARRIHAEAIGIDSHIDTLQRVLNGKEDISRRTGKGHVTMTAPAQGRRDARAVLCLVRPDLLQGRGGRAAHASSSATRCSQCSTRTRIRLSWR